MITKLKKRAMDIISIITMRVVKAMATITAMTTIIIVTNTITKNLVRAVISI
jgi:hypothetical protein